MKDLKKDNRIPTSVGMSANNGIPASAGMRSNNGRTSSRSFWGKGIAATYIIFVIVTLSMTYAMMTKDVDLVSTNYYEKEIKYQDQINKINNTKKLAEGLKFELTPGAVVFTFPKLGDITGEYTFYRPSDSKKDFKIKIKADKDNKQAIDVSTFQKGYWKVKIEWKSGGVEYYNEEQIII